MRSLFMKREDADKEDLRSDETAPGVRLIKQVWKINTDKPPREKAPERVNHDIYHVPSRKNDVPRRQFGDGRV